MSFGAIALAQATPVCGPLAGQTGNCTMAPPTYTPLSPIGQPQFVYDLPVPVAYMPDTAMFPGFDYYEISIAPVKMVHLDQTGTPCAPTAANATTCKSLAFPNHYSFLKKTKATIWPAPGVPDGMQWLGLIGPKGVPVFTEVWGYAQTNNGGGPLLGRASYPSMTFEATRGTPVKVKWINSLPNQHLFCKDPINSNVPCAIDRTLMGAQGTPYVGAVVNGKQEWFGTSQSPDNAQVIHLHGGEIPPDADGFAELWIGNGVTSAAYSRNATTNTIEPQPINPPLDVSLAPANDIPLTTVDYAARTYDPVTDPATYKADAAALLEYQKGQLLRPTGSSIVYNYPMVQEPATIWYHDHALGKTRVNVAAGPAGFFLVGDRGKPLSIEDQLYGVNGAPALLPPKGDCSPTGIYGNPLGSVVAPGNCYDIPIAFQDRSFNTDGSINFPNALGQTPLVAGLNPLTPGPNPLVHPQWVPEYFGDFAVVNGVIWPRLKVQQRAYRFRMLDGSNARCYTFGLKTAAAAGPPAFVQIGTDQGYLPYPVTLNSFTLCPGERADVVIDFSKFTAGDIITVTNTANAPFPNGIGTGQNTIYSQMAQLMQFQVVASTKAPWTVPTALVAANNTTVATPPHFSNAPAGAPRIMVLNEVLDPATAAPLRVQIDGKPFEAAVTEIPKRGTTEVWNIVNTTVDAHPMHLHLVKFRVVSRQKVNVNSFGKAIGLAGLVNGGVLTPVADLTPYLMNAPRPPEVNEVGWKDTAKAYPGEVLTIEAKWDGAWADDATKAGPGMPYWEPVTSGPYVWHCHIVDHEDNEMMRPVLVMP